MVFTHAHFQRIAQITSLCDLHNICEGIPSLMHFWLLSTLASGIDVGQGINVGPGKFGKKNKRRALNI